MQINLTPVLVSGKLAQVEISSTTPDHRSGSCYMRTTTDMDRAYDYVINTFLAKLPSFSLAMQVTATVNLVTGTVTLDLTEALKEQAKYAAYTGPM